MNIITNYISNSNLDIKIINQKNEGAAGARQTAFNNSQSPYIVFLDSDDYVDPNYLEVLIRTIEETKTNICISRICYHPTHFPLIGVKNANIKGTYDLLYDKEMLPIMQCITTAKIYKRENDNN